jgi:UDP-N-acetylmuramate-alanine ligase
MAIKFLIYLSANLIIIGNVMKRGMPIIEYILDNNLLFMSGPEFLAKFVLSNKICFSSNWYSW